jgi:hypothetical protein
MANKNGNPIQLFCVLLIMAWITLGPMMEDCGLSQYSTPFHLSDTSLVGDKGQVCM